MAKKKITNPLIFKKSFFLNIAKLRLTPCEFRCLMVMLEGEERTKAQIAVILEDTPQHVGIAMIHLEKLGLVVNTRTEGRNSFFKPNRFFRSGRRPKSITILDGGYYVEKIKSHAET